jgi:hypothetical protein
MAVSHRAAYICPSSSIFWGFGSTGQLTILTPDTSKCALIEEAEKGKFGLKILLSGESKILPYNSNK